MAVSRTVHGLAGLIESDMSGSESDDCGKFLRCKASKSVFDVPGIFNEDVTRKLREGERIQLEMATAVESPKKTLELIDLTNSPSRIDDNVSPVRKRPRRTRSSRGSSFKSYVGLRNYVHLITSDSDDHSDCSDNGGDYHMSKRSSRVSDASLIDLNISHRTELDDETEGNIYRVVITQICNEDARVIVRLTEKDNMQKLFSEAAIITGRKGILMMGSEENRREVLPEDTVQSLGLSTVGLTRMEFVPISGHSDTHGASPAGFRIKFITGNRRETKEIRCKSNEPLGAIFKRYCVAAGVQRTDVVFKFDDEIMEDNGTPAQLGIDSGDIVEAHLQHSHRN
ncbi:uncharacterized protein LOC111258858 [Varroa jacobsoni]|nr:uncharacterized protein LOC111243344 isoform X2 [Varroa destructor]XP_022686142.1 uncharacterized protein LOC111258858 [Varroa jacobsoni]